jgi:hypothetical protein
MPADFHVGDTGTVIEVELLENGQPLPGLAAATIKQLIFQKPDKSIVVKTAQFSTNGSDGLIRYITEAGFLDQDRTWKVQGKVTLPSGTWSSEIGEFVVEKNLQ